MDSVEAVTNTTVAIASGQFDEPQIQPLPEVPQAIAVTVETQAPPMTSTHAAPAVTVNNERHTQTTGLAWA